MKISYWRQYEHGKISKEGVRTLVQAVEVAADSDDARVNLEQLGTLWKPKVTTRSVYLTLIFFLTEFGVVVEILATTLLLATTQKWVRFPHSADICVHELVCLYWVWVFLCIVCMY
jgi:hypothetical protein